MQVALIFATLRFIAVASSAHDATIENCSRFLGRCVPCHEDKLCFCDDDQKHAVTLPCVQFPDSNERYFKWFEENGNPVCNGAYFCGPQREFRDLCSNKSVGCFSPPEIATHFASCLKTAPRLTSSKPQFLISERAESDLLIWVLIGLNAAQSIIIVATIVTFFLSKKRCRENREELIPMDNLYEVPGARAVQVRDETSDVYDNENAAPLDEATASEYVEPKVLRAGGRSCQQVQEHPEFEEAVEYSAIRG